MKDQVLEDVLGRTVARLVEGSWVEAEVGLAFVRTTSVLSSVADLVRALQVLATEPSLAKRQSRSSQPGEQSGLTMITGEELASGAVAVEEGAGH
jgi:hypothetical protein